jgi:CBS domain-containing protein
MKIKDIMTPAVRIISPDCTLKEAARLMKENGFGALPVHDGNDRLAGMITDRDITIQAVALGADPNTRQVKDFLSGPIVYGFDDQSIEDGVKKMKEKQLRRLVVLNRQKRLVGIVSLSDIALNVQNRALAADAVVQISRSA